MMLQSSDLPIRVLAVDPGITTGLCLASIEPDKVYIACTEERLREDEFYSFVIYDTQPMYLICEDFEYRPGKAKPNLELFSVRLIGICALLAQQSHAESQFFLQKAAVGKGHFTDVKLKQMNLYSTENHHGRDAARHFLHWLVFGYGMQFLEGQDIELVSYGWLYDRPIKPAGVD